MWPLTIAGNILLRIKRLATCASNLVCSCVPSTVLEVTCINCDTDEITEIYNAHRQFYTWSRAESEIIRDLSIDNFYVFRVWNADTKSSESYFVSGEHLANSFHMKSLYALYGLTDYGIIDMLSNYVELNGMSLSILGILVPDLDGGADKEVSSHHMIQPLLRSLAIPNNITALAFTMLCEYYNLIKVQPVKPKAETNATDTVEADQVEEADQADETEETEETDKTDKVTIVNFDMDETSYFGEEYLMPRRNE